MQALVTGGSGFIGSEVISQLIGRDVRVRALLRTTSPRQNLKGLEFEEAIGDLGDVDSLKEAVRGVDYVFHLAGAVAARNREEFLRHNAQGTANLAKACAEVNPGIKRFVYVSSLAACGPAKQCEPLTEGHPEEPVSAYGESKLEGERELKTWAQKAGFAYTVLRPPAVYGPRDKAILEFIKVVNSGIIPVFPASSGRGDKYYSVIHVEDLVGGIVLAGLADGQGASETFFLAGDGLHTWTELMRSMADALGKKPIALKLPKAAWTGLAAVYTAAGWVLRKQFPLTLDKLSELRPDYWICSNDRAKKVLGFQPKWDLKQGMHHTVSWYKQRGWI